MFSRKMAYQTIWFTSMEKRKIVSVPVIILKHLHVCIRNKQLLNPYAAGVKFGQYKMMQNT